MSGYPWRELHNPIYYRLYNIPPNEKCFFHRDASSLFLLKSLATLMLLLPAGPAIFYSAMGWLELAPLFYKQPLIRYLLTSDCSLMKKYSSAQHPLILEASLYQS